MTPEHSQKWVALIVTKEDGTEDCPWLMTTTGDDPLTGPIDISKIRVEGNSYLIELAEKQGPSTKSRVELLTWKEIIDRGYRENPPL